MKDKHKIIVVSLDNLLADILKERGLVEKAIEKQVPKVFDEYGICLN